MFSFSYYAVSAVLSFLFWSFLLGPGWALGIVCTSALATYIMIRRQLRYQRNAAEDALEILLRGVK